MMLAVETRNSTREAPMSPLRRMEALFQQHPHQLQRLYHRYYINFNAFQRIDLILFRSLCVLRPTDITPIQTLATLTTNAPADPTIEE